jgi:NifB/MoaA-like Fe-S oxidoreductase
VIFCSDEFYIKAGLPLPPEDFYEGYPQLDNGVGMITSMKNEFMRELEFIDD